MRVKVRVRGRGLTAIAIKEAYNQAYNQAIEDFKRELLGKNCFLFDYEKYMIIEHIAERLKEGAE